MILAILILNIPVAMLTLVFPGPSTHRTDESDESDEYSRLKKSQELDADPRKIKILNHRNRIRFDKN
jgi:hypothetical protein